MYLSHPEMVWGLVKGPTGVTKGAGTYLSHPEAAWGIWNKVPLG